MSDKIKLELNRLAAGHIRQSFVEQLEQKQLELDGVAGQVAELEETIRLIDEQLKQPTKSANGTMTPSGRMKKGAAKDRIVTMFETFAATGVIGGGLSLKEICLKTGVPWSSAYRIVSQSGLFTEQDGKWTLKKK